MHNNWIRSLFFRRRGASGRSRVVLSRLVLLVLFLSLLPLSGQAEMYVAGQLGVTLPNSLSDVELSGGGLPPGTTSSDLELRNSLAYGAKLGYYFDSVKWLGVETEVFNTTPHLKQQTATFTAPGFGSTSGILPGQYLRVLNWAPINVVVRYQLGRLEPYAGIGMGVFFARLKDAASGESESSTSVGLNTQLGLRYLLNKNVSVFGEWKYNRAGFDFGGSAGRIEGDYSAHILAFGVGYHFN